MLEEYLEFLLDIKNKYNKYKATTLIQYDGLRYPVKNLLKELDIIINTPSNKIKPPNWFRVGWILAQYFGVNAIKMVYGNKIKISDL